MLDFSDITIDDKELLDPYLQIDGQIMSDRCFASLYIWSAKYKLKKCIKDGFLYICAFKDYTKGQLCYYMPLGMGKTHGAIKNILDDAAERNVKPLIAIITEERAEEFKEFEGGALKVCEEPCDYDYVYLSEKMISLAGKKLHSKRNFTNRFRSLYNWEYRDISPADKNDILRFLEKTCDGNNSRDLELEREAIITALDNFEKLGMLGGFLTVDGEIVAFTLACKQRPDVMDILIEKADRAFIGAYPMIFNQFAKKHCEDCKYINREEDLGIEGLRTSKLSYCPEFLTKKYVAFFNK